MPAEFFLHDAKLAYIAADGSVSNIIPLAHPTDLVFAPHPDTPNFDITFSAADLSASAEFSATWTYPMLTHRQYRQITMLLFGRKRYSNKIEHNIARRQARAIAKLRARYPGIGQAFDDIVADLRS